MAIAMTIVKTIVKTIPTLQEVAELLRNAAYSDDQSNEIVWSLRVLHPKTNEGVVGFNGAIWHRADPRNKKNKGRRNISISFAFEEKNGITHFHLWRDNCEIVGHLFGTSPTLEQLKEMIIREFGIVEMYDPDK